MTPTRSGIALAALLSLRCGAAAPTPAAPAATATAPPSGSCGARVVIAFYTGSDCSAATEVGRRTYDTAQACFAWTAVGSNAQENSATRFQCYRDRVCYTQHPNTLDCSGALATDKESRTALCLKEPQGALYSRIVSGTESCPEPPPGFACPSSTAGNGTGGVAACTR